MISWPSCRALKNRSFLASRSGEVAIEYALIAALITILLVASMVKMGDSTAGMFDSVKIGWEDALEKAPGGPAESESETE